MTSATGTIAADAIQSESADMPRRFSLSDSRWQLSAADDELLGFSVQGIPARVPGNVQDDLESAGLLAPNDIGMGDPRWLTIGRSAWIYRRSISIPPLRAEDRVRLVFDGVDFSCRIRIDGIEVGANSGMFRRFVVDISSHVRSGSIATLEVEIAGAPDGIEDALRASDGEMSGEGSPDFFVYANNHIRRALGDLKSPTAASYDWAVNTWTIGIWRDVELVVTGQMWIDELRVDVVLDDDKAFLNLSAEVWGDISGSPIVRFTVLDPDGGIAAQTVVERSGSDQLWTASGLLRIDSPRLWWPAGFGEHPLYSVRAEVASTGQSRATDSVERRVGMRNVQWCPVEDAPEGSLNHFQLLVNGVRIRTIGSNLITPDLLYGRIGRHATWLLRAALAAGMNTLRLWGGGVLLPDALYDFADEHGLMFIQEFFLGNCLPEDDEEFLENLDQTVRSIVRRVRHHASIIEWGGGNEMHWLEADDFPALRVMRSVVAQEDTRVFRATCPMEGSRHAPWHFDPAQTYRYYDGEGGFDGLSPITSVMRYGEFGTSAPAHQEVWERCIPEASRWPFDSFDDEILVRKNVFGAVFSAEHWSLLTLVEEYFGASRSLQSFIRGGQFLGAEGLRYAVDALRRRGPRLGGLTTWDFNEPWPNGAGSFLVDYEGRPMLGFGFVSQALEPVAFTLKYDGLLHRSGEEFTVGLFLASDAAETARDLNWTLTVYSLEGDHLHDWTGHTQAVEPLDVVWLGDVVLRMPEDGAPILVHATLNGERDQLVGERLHVFGSSDVAAPFAALLPAGRLPGAAEIGAAGVDPSNPLNLAAAVNGGRLIGVSGSEFRDTDPSVALIDGRYVQTPESYRSASSWHSTTEEGFFEIELAKTDDVSRVCLGRDRSGRSHDRSLDAIRIELSDDGFAWAEVAKFDRLAPLLGSRLGGQGATLRPAYLPVWTLDVRFPATRARYIRVTVQGRRGDPRFVALDEVEVYADPAIVVEEPQFIVRDGREASHQLPSTTLEAIVTSATTENDGLEVLHLEVANVGTAMALFCEVGAVGAYRPRLLSSAVGLSIPPGESRVISVRSDPAMSPPQAASVWQVSAWNAEPCRVQPLTSRLEGNRS